MVEEYAIAGEDTVGFAVVRCYPVGIHLGHAVRAVGMEGGLFALGYFLNLAEQLRSGGLVNSGFLLEAEQAYGFQQAHGSESVTVGRIFRLFKAHGHMA